MIELDSRVTVNNFQVAIESWVHKNGMGYLEAVLFYCEKNNVEIEAVASLIKKSESIKAKLEAECEDQNMIQKKPRLPI